MKILVTGGNGFVGRHLVSRLVQEGHETVILDNFSTSKAQENAGKNVIKGDIRDASDVARAMKGCEAVFHLAALTDFRSNDKNADYEVNYLGSKRVFEQAKSQNAKIIFISTAAIYGDATVCKEDMNCKPISQYGISKLKAENSLRKEVPESFIVRPFNIYGPNGKSVINVFCRNVPNYKPIKIFGNGMQTRDYIHVSDVVSALILGIDKSGIYNVGTGKEASLLEILDIIQAITRAKPEYKFELPIASEIKRSKADISKIKKELRWEPKIDLKSGILKTLEEEGWKKIP